MSTTRTYVKKFAVLTQDFSIRALRRRETSSLSLREGDKLEIDGKHRLLDEDGNLLFVLDNRQHKLSRDKFRLFTETETIDV